MAISAAATTKTRNTSTAPAVVADLLRERDEAQVDAVQHELHAHQHDEHVAADDDAGEAQREERRRRRDQHRQVIHGGGVPTSSTASAATTAATSSTETSSKWSQ